MSDNKNLARPTDPALVSDQAPAGLGGSRFDPSRVAKKLSLAQRKALRVFCERDNSPWGYFAADLGVSGAACSALTRMGLLLAVTFPGDRAKAYRWTNDGNAVFQALPPNPSQGCG